MKVIKNINNNVAICLDSNNNEVVAFGKGIGFSKAPYEVPLSKIERTYYDVEPVYLSMINCIPDNILDLSAKIIDYAKIKLDNPVSSNIVFTLADHINFAIQRFEKNMNINLPIVHDIQYLFEIEMEIGTKALEMIRKELKVYLPKEEASYIALHIINSQSMNANKRNEKMDKDHIQRITEIIEDFYMIKIDKDGFNYSRFVSHMHYLIKRSKKNEMIQTVNSKMIESLKQNYPDTYQCSLLVSNYFKNVLNTELNDEECMYLMLHINRLCSREDCNQ